MDTDAAHPPRSTAAMTEAVEPSAARVRASDRTRSAVLPLFTMTIFLGAVLVFGVQPIVAKQLLPQFGGSPAVWSATSVFF